MYGRLMRNECLQCGSPLYLGTCRSMIFDVQRYTEQWINAEFDRVIARIGDPATVR